jgi:imidazolonepropionase-like amidohydrolase
MMANKTMNTERPKLKETPEKQVLRAGWLIDGLGGPVATDQIVVLHKGRIHSIKPWDPALAAALEPVDLTDATVLPALMDAHVHLVLSGTLDDTRRQAQMQQTPEEARQAVLAHLQNHLDSGIVAVRDGGDKGGQVLMAKKQQRSLVHLSATCWAWHAPGRYGGMIGRAPGPGQSLSRAVAGAARGADHIKLIQSGINSLASFGRPTAPQFSCDELVAVRQYARSRGLPIMVHANGSDAVRSALDAGCDSIEHGYFMGPDNLMRAADQQVFWVPTAAPMAALARPGLLPAEQADVARRTLDHQLEQVAAARRFGVRIALGTDAGSLGVDHGTAVHRELALLMSAGMSLSQAVRCATIHTATLLGLADRGALQPGCSADLIIVNGSPDHLPASLANIQGLCIRGMWCKNPDYSLSTVP